MINFLLCAVKYLVEMAVLLGVGLLGACVGLKLRKHKNAKTAAVQKDTTEE